MQEVIIIGAGAAGLMAARELSASGRSVVLLEAAERTGGRIHTIEAPGFGQPIELGAEFIHGHLPISFELLKEAGLKQTNVTGCMVRVKNGQWQQQQDFTIDWDLLMQKMQALEEDMPMATFLQTRFPGDEYAQLRRSVQGFAEGFDVADIDRVSTLALREEWSHEEDEQYRIAGGYGQLVGFLADQCRRQDVAVHTGCVVKTVDWQKGRATVGCANGQSFTACKLIMTVPLGVLQADAGQPAAIAFSPLPEGYLDAAGKIGYGSVTKLLLQFRNAFWNDYAQQVGFILGEAAVGTWWTQTTSTAPAAGASMNANLLTGWKGGPGAALLKGLDEAAILQAGLLSLAEIFNKPVESLQALLVAGKAVDWRQEPFALGAYSYDTVETAAARRLLRQPLQNTLFFAGEALYDGPSPGTVEAALHSGRETARRVIEE